MPYLIARGRKHDFSARVSLSISAPGATVTIGRATEVDVQLVDRSVSKLHASLELIEDGRYRVVDLGSTNGLQFEGRRCTELTVVSGQEFVLGSLLVTISETGPETFRIPESVPRPEPGELAEGATVDAGQEVRARGRLVWVGAGVSVVLIAFLGWALPDWLDRSNRSGLPDPNSSDAAVADSSPESEADELDSAVTREVPPLGTLISTEDPIRGDWVALGRELDSTCDSPGCHVTSNEVSFGGGTQRQYGRWSRNLLRMKSRDAVPSRSARGFVLPAFSPSPPHAEDILLSLSDDAMDGTEVVRQSKRLHGVDDAEFPFGALVDVDTSTIVRMRRMWRALYGRDPSLTEFAWALERSLNEIAAEAEKQPEFWRERARRSLRGRGEFSADGGFAIPETLDPKAIPSNTKLWAELLEREVVRVRALTTHPYGDAPPYPGEDDSAYAGWLFELVAGRRRPMPPDHFLRSVWSVLWGAPPSDEEDAVLRGIVREVRRDANTWVRVLDAMLYAPSMPFPSPPSGAERQWVASVTSWLLARELPEASTESIGDALASGALDPRLVLRACLTSNEFARLPFTEKQPPATTAITESIRVEVFAPFSVRALLAKPERAPRLRKWCEKSLVQTFRDDSVPMFQLAPRAIARRGHESTSIVSHGGLCGSVYPRGIIVADGYFSPALRRLADRVGDARVLAPAASEFEWLRGQLGVTPELVFSDSEVGRIAGYRFSSKRWEAAAQSPATRALLAAAAVASESTSMVVWVALDGVPATPETKSSGEPTVVWREFVDALNILASVQRSANFDVWLWGRSVTGEVETVRMRWGPSIARGWVHRESQPARFSHPELQFENFERERR